MDESRPESASLAVIPACASCGGKRWSSVEELAGGRRRYELRDEGWTLVDEDLELVATTYRCDDCGNATESGDEVWIRLNDLPTV